MRRNRKNKSRQQILSARRARELLIKRRRAARIQKYRRARSTYFSGKTTPFKIKSFNAGGGSRSPQIPKNNDIAYVPKPIKTIDIEKRFNDLEKSFIKRLTELENKFKKEMAAKDKIIANLQKQIKAGAVGMPDFIKDINIVEEATFDTAPQGGETSDEDMQSLHLGGHDISGFIHGNEASPSGTDEFIERMHRSNIDEVYLKSVLRKKYMEKTGNYVDPDIDLEELLSLL